MNYATWKDFPSLIAATTMREGGVSLPPYDELNLSFTVGDDPKAVQENRRLWLEDIDVLPEQIIFTAQSHSTIIQKVSLNDGGRGYASFEDGIPADALYTSDTNLFLAIYHADCVPIFFYAPKRGLVGIIHAGDKGTLKGISEKVINEVLVKEKLSPRDLYFYFGPSVSFGHNEISQDEAESIAASEKEYARAIKRSLGKYFFDTPFSNFLQLRKIGVPVENITLSGLCTHENDDLFFAAGKHDPSGRNCSFIGRV